MQEAMEICIIPTEMAGVAGDEAQYPDIILFADTLEITSQDNVKYYFSTDCADLIVEPSANGSENSYKIQSRGPVIGEDNMINPRFYISSNKTISRQCRGISAGFTVQGELAGNIGDYIGDYIGDHIGQEGTLKIRFSISRFFQGKLYSNQGGVQRESMNKGQLRRVAVNPVVTTPA